MQREYFDKGEKLGQQILATHARTGVNNTLHVFPPKGNRTSAADSAAAGMLCGVLGWDWRACFWHPTYKASLERMREHAEARGWVIHEVDPAPYR